MANDVDLLATLSQLINHTRAQHATISRLEGSLVGMNATVNRLLNRTQSQDATITQLEVASGSVCPEMWISSDLEFARMQSSLASCVRSAARLPPSLSSSHY